MRQTFEHMATVHKVVPLRRETGSRCSCAYTNESFATDEGIGCYHQSTDEPDLRCYPVHEISLDGFGPAIRHTGWYADEAGTETVYGLVYRLPHDRGYLAGATMGKGMLTQIDRSIIHDERDAVYAADGMAEHWSEQLLVDDAEYNSLVCAELEG